MGSAGAQKGEEKAEEGTGGGNRRKAAKPRDDARKNVAAPKQTTAKPPKKAAKSPPVTAIIVAEEERVPERDEKTSGDWFAGIGAGIKGASRKLFDHVPPEIREKVVEQARSRGPGVAAAAVNAAALKTRSLKAKLALKTLGGLLKLLDSKNPKK